MLCDHLGGGIGRVGGRRKMGGYGNICIHIADSLCYTTETNKIVKQLYSNKEVKKKKKRLFWLFGVFCVSIQILRFFVLVL